MKIHRVCAAMQRFISFVAIPRAYASSLAVVFFIFFSATLGSAVSQLPAQPSGVCCVPCGGCARFACGRLSVHHACVVNTSCVLLCSASLVVCYWEDTHIVQQAPDVDASMLPPRATVSGRVWRLPLASVFSVSP